MSTLNRLGVENGTHSPNGTKSRFCRSPFRYVTEKKKEATSQVSLPSKTPDHFFFYASSASNFIMDENGPGSESDRESSCIKQARLLMQGVGNSNREMRMECIRRKRQARS